MRDVHAARDRPALARHRDGRHVLNGPALRATGYTLAALGAAFVGALYVVRFVLPVDPLEPHVGTAQSLRDAAVFRAAWPLFALYAAGVGWALFEGVGALRLALSEGRAAPRFVAACALAAVSGALLASVRGAAVPGGGTMLFYWWGLAVLWLVALARLLAGTRAGQRAVVRDWTAYAYALALLPLTFLPSVPLWHALDAMTLDEATITACTASFASHYLVAHLLIYEVAARRRARAA